MDQCRSWQYVVCGPAFGSLQRVLIAGNVLRRHVVGFQWLCRVFNLSRAKYRGIGWSVWKVVDVVAVGKTAAIEEGEGIDKYNTIVDRTKNKPELIVDERTTKSCNRNIVGMVALRTRRMTEDWDSYEYQGSRTCVAVAPYLDKESEWARSRDYSKLASANCQTNIERSIRTNSGLLLDRKEVKVSDGEFILYNNFIRYALPLVRSKKKRKVWVYAITDLDVTQR